MMKRICLLGFVFLNVLVSVIGQKISIDIPVGSNELAKDQINCIIRSDKAKIFKTPTGYAIYSTVYDLNPSGTLSFAKPVMIKLDQNKNIVSAEKIFLPVKSSRKEHSDFVNYMFFPKSAYLIANKFSRDEGYTKYYAFQYWIGDESVDEKNFMELKNLSIGDATGGRFLEIPRLNKYVFFCTQVIEQKLEVSVFDLPEILTPSMEPIKVYIKPGPSTTGIKIKDLLIDSKGNITIIYIEIQESGNCQIMHCGYNKASKKITLTKIYEGCQNVKTGADALDNYYLLVEGAKTSNSYDAEAFTLIKLDKDGKFVNKSVISISAENKLRYNSGLGYGSNTTSKEITFSISKDGTVGAFLLKLPVTFDWIPYGVGYNYYYKSFHWIAFNTATLASKTTTLGRYMTSRRTNLEPEYVIEGNSSLSLLTYDHQKNASSGLSAKELKTVYENSSYDPKEFALYSYSLDNKLNLKMEKLIYPQQESIIKLPLLKTSENEYLFFNSEDTKYTKFRVGTLKVQ